MKIRRLSGILAAVWLGLVHAAALGMPPFTEPVNGTQAILYCVESEQTLYEKDADTPVPPASVTKLMTALLVLEQIPDLSTQTTVSETAVAIERDSTHIGLLPGEQVSLQDMLYATLMQSANDAANVLAECVSGTQQAFAERMNARAAALGCTGSHFENAHGLDGPTHLMTARDVALIAAALVEEPRFLEISKAQTYTIPATNKQPEPRTFYTKQRMLNPESAFYNPYAIAGKNGYTSKAHHTQCIIAQRDGMTLIAVSLGASADKYAAWRDMRALMQYGLNQFHIVSLDAAQIGEPNAPPVKAVVPLDATAANLHLSQAPDAQGFRMIELVQNGQAVPLFPMPYTLARDRMPVQTDEPEQIEAPQTAPGSHTFPGEIILLLSMMGLLGLGVSTGTMRAAKQSKYTAYHPRHMRKKRKKKPVSPIRETDDTENTQS